jgi:hypothetical protein
MVALESFSATVVGSPTLADLRAEFAALGERIEEFAKADYAMRACDANSAR